MRPTSTANPENQTSVSSVAQSQLIPSEKDRKLVQDDSRVNRHADRFAHIRKLIDAFSQKILNFLFETHDITFTDWISKDETGHFLVTELKKAEVVYPKHVIAFRDFIHFLGVVNENLDLINQLLTNSRYGIPGALYTLSNLRQTCKKTQKFLSSFTTLQKSIGAIKQLPIDNRIISGSLYLYGQVSRYLQGEGDDLTKVFQVMKEAVCSSELLELKSDVAEDALLENKKFSVKDELELDYWKILFATNDAQREAARTHATSVVTAQGGGALAPEVETVCRNIQKFCDTPAWNTKRLSFLECAKNLPVPPNTTVTGEDRHRMQPEKFWRYALKLKSILAKIIEVSPEFMAEDNDSSASLRQLGSLLSFPTEMIQGLDHTWFTEVIRWLGANYSKLCENPELKKIIQSKYDIFTHYLSGLDELEAQLGLKFGLLTHDLQKNLRKQLEPTWLGLSHIDGDYGPMERNLRNQADVSNSRRTKIHSFFAQFLKHLKYFFAQCVL